MSERSQRRALERAQHVERVRRQSVSEWFRTYGGALNRRRAPRNGSWIDRAVERMFPRGWR